MSEVYVNRFVLTVSTSRIDVWGLELRHSDGEVSVRGEVGNKARDENTNLFSYFIFSRCHGAQYVHCKVLLPKGLASDVLNIRLKLF